MKLSNYPLITGKDRSSFAFFTVNIRFPKIIKDVIETNDFPRQINEQLNQVAEAMPRYAIHDIQPRNPSKFWDTFYERNLDKPISDIGFFDAEIYLYELILSITGYADYGIDPFFNVKSREVLDAVDKMDKLLKTADQMSLEEAAYLSLTGNQADLSQLERAKDLELLVDDRKELFTSLSKASTLHFFHDNSASELYADLIVVFVMSRHFTDLHFKLYFKKRPLLVSDATLEDLSFLFDMADTALDDHFHELKRNNRLETIDDEFWNLPTHFTDVPHCPAIKISPEDVLISKGDLNYRRFFEDREIPVDFKGGAKLSNHQYVFRTLKSEILAGYDEEKARALHESEPDWMYKGKYAVIQKL